MIYISIGSNVGNRLYNIQQVLQKLNAYDFQIIYQSPIIETKALLLEGAPSSWDKPFYNMIVAGKTSASPEVLQHQLQTIEQELGKNKNAPRWAPRTIDLDILLIDDKIINTKDLIIPHPELLHRDFLIHLMAIIAGEKKHPIAQKSFYEIAYCTKTLESFTYSIVAFPAFVGVVNITPDSFSDGNYFLNPEKAIQRILTLDAEGTSIIELGAQSVSPVSQAISEEEEWRRLQPVLDELLSFIHERKLRISVDTFSEKIISKVIDHYPIHWINDVTGKLSKLCLSKIAERNIPLVTMHSLSLPPTQKNVIDFTATPIEIITEWAEKQISALTKIGFSQQNIIIDPGIGFNKTRYQNLSLLRYGSSLKKLGSPILIGHSRKIFIDIFNAIDPHQRDIETLAVSDFLASQSIDYLRVHNVKDHQRFFTTKGAFHDFPH